MFITACCDMFAVNAINNIFINCFNELLMCSVKIQLEQNRPCFYINILHSLLSNKINRYNNAQSVRLGGNTGSPETLAAFAIFRHVKRKFNSLYLFPSFSKTGGDPF